MLRAFSRFPTLVNMSLIAAAAMVLPALHAVWLRDFELASIFMFYAVISAVLALMGGITMARVRRGGGPSQQVLTLLIAYFCLPAILAIPLAQAVPSITFQQAYFEMLSCLTTTGATIFSDPSAIADPLNLWRGLVAWSGGLMILVAAVAVLGPLQMGGFEVEHATARGVGDERLVRAAGVDNARTRLMRQTRLILPPYVIVTGCLTLGLVLLGDRALVALVHAMSIVSTSGITPLSDFSTAASGRAGEMLIFLFLLVVITRRATSTPRWDMLRETIDPEMRLALIAITSVTALLFLRHFIGAFEVQGQENFGAAGQALWGSLFSILSFLSTTGFESRDWSAMQNWSGLSTSGIILLALCIMGGGIATTTGGVKLLRVYALYKHGVREMQRLIHPNSVGGAGITARRIRRRGAQIAWVFLMLFLIALSLSLLALTALGLEFEAALALAIAALTTTGPAVALMDPDLSFTTIGPGAQMILSVVMVFGRLELLVLISVLNPYYWRA